MNISPKSLFADIPRQLPFELCQTLFENPSIRIERIVSEGHVSAENFWYDQEQSEWVMLLQGQAKLSIMGADSVELNPGDYLLLPTHCKHRVDWSSKDPACIWLAIYIAEQDS